MGKLIAEACGRNLVPVKLELGGKGAAVVFEEVDLEATAQALVAAVTLNPGQVCCTATRWVVQERVYSTFVSKAADALARLALGHGFDTATQMGPVVSEKQRQRVLGPDTFLDYLRPQSVVRLSAAGT